jgi:serine phosphatase RsbU (regulator of sigma subunit)
MAATISSIRLIAEESTSVSETMQRLNRFLVRNTSSRSFAAVLFAVIDVETKRMRWSNAGLPEPILLSNGGRARFLEMERYPLPPGASSRSAYVEAEVELKAGDTVLFVTDGVVEIRPVDDSTRELGFEGLLGLLSIGGWRDPKKLLDSLAEALRNFRNGKDFEDDITAVAIQINGGK